MEQVTFRFGIVLLLVALPMLMLFVGGVWR
jgi:hypothetical protein